MDTYKSTNTLNGRFYIGSTKDFEKRKKQHLTSKDNYPFQNALRKNPEVFEWEVWSDDSDEPILEQALLEMWFGTEQCYNLNPKADRPPSQAGKKRSKGAVKKTSEAHRGKTRSLTTKQKLSEAAKRRRHSENTKRKISENNKGKHSKSPSEETRKKLSEAGKGKTHSEQTREKIAKANRGRTGRTHNKETKETLSRVRKGKKWFVNSEGQTVAVFNCPGSGWQAGRIWKC